MERVLPKILRGAIEDIYQTPFRILCNFGKQQLNKIKKRYCVRHNFIIVEYFTYKDQTTNYDKLNKIYNNSP